MKKRGLMADCVLGDSLATLGMTRLTTDFVLGDSLGSASLGMTRRASAGEGFSAHMKLLHKKCNYFSSPP